MNKIEQVARALDPMSAKLADVLLEKGLKHKDVLAILPMDKARAAIEAMRVPTEGMVDAAYAYDNSGAQLSESYDVIYTVMIDAAMEGK